jgi:predicted nucleic acid-binding protein
VIVADVSLVAYLFIRGDRTPAAEAVLARDPEWAAPLLWRSEWRNVLAGYLKSGFMTLDEAIEYVAAAEVAFRGREHLVDGGNVLELVRRSGCSAYDCEYVALAEALGVPLVTHDCQVLGAFPGQAVAPEAFVV